MCGIVGYVGKNQALPVLLDGLAALEYRGYDSAGVAIFSEEKATRLRKVGPVAVLKEAAKDGIMGSIGIGHTRWATHGEPNEVNAHPHADCNEAFFIVHNGIIENYKELRQVLIEKGHTILSETDTELVAHLWEDFVKETGDIKTGFFNTVRAIKGAYALVGVAACDPSVIYASRLSSPMVIGVGEDEHFIASDPSALVGRTQNVVYLNDGEIAQITQTHLKVADLNEQPADYKIEQFEINLEQAQKGSYPHFMLKEIFEGPEVVRTTFRGRLKTKDNIVKLGGLEQVDTELSQIKRLIITACGTSYYAGLMGEYLFEELTRLPVEVQFASEFRYRDEPFDKHTAVLAISQSGETADTLAALRKAKENNLLTLGVVNTVRSTIARETTAGVYNHAGPEIGVASTKAFLSQMTVLTLIAAYMARERKDLYKQILQELENIPDKIEKILAQHEKIAEIAEKYKHYKNFLFLGRRYNYPVALEGALKLKEISYIHAEGYGAGEMKHGPIAMIGEDFPTVAIVPQNSVTEKMYTNLEEIKARRGPIMAIATEGDERIKSLTEDVIYVPSTVEPLEPFLTVIPLQLFAYYIGTGLGHNVDKPKNLAKSVTVE
jgi:glucosamine--fructose-6-phosphate aminotransferase (isomerizing)